MAVILLEDFPDLYVFHPLLSTALVYRTGRLLPGPLSTDHYPVTPPSYSEYCCAPLWAVCALAMPIVYYRLESSSHYDQVTFSEDSIPLPELRAQIMKWIKLACPLKIYDEKVYQEYKEQDRVPSDTSVVLIPEMISSDQTLSIPPPDLTLDKPGQGTSHKVSKDFTAVANFIKASDLATSTATEEEKIKYVSTFFNWMMNSDQVKNEPPAGYVCHLCYQPGHYKKSCPDKMSVQKIKEATGIPKTFLMPIDDATMTGAMRTSSGTLAIPIINAQAYAVKKKYTPPFREPSPTPAPKEKIPDELLCPLCGDIMSYAATIPCCGISCCDDCIRTELLASDVHECPICHHIGVSPDLIEANKRLRQWIENGDNMQKLSCLLPADPAPSASAEEDILLMASQAEALPPPLPPASASRLDPALQSHPLYQMYAMEQHLANSYMLGYYHHHYIYHHYHHYRSENPLRADRRERREHHHRSRRSPGHRHSRETQESHQKRHHRKESERTGSHSTGHHRSHSRARSPFHRRIEHREERPYCSKSHSSSYSRGPSGRRDRSPYRDHYSCSTSRNKKQKQSSEVEASKSH